VKYEELDVTTIQLYEELNDTHFYYLFVQFLLDRIPRTHVSDGGLVVPH